MTDSPPAPRRAPAGKESGGVAFVTAYAPQIDEGGTLGVGAERPRFLKAFADRAVAAGHAGSSYAALIERFRKPSV
ncbi:hypothetical protein [Streptomyces sp. NPDC088757]|uniref:imine reductase family protein n=1 Tax=Streptomyces sp. NPDC088757 TaxID=3365889 RepID=UPI003824C2AF